MIHVSKVILHSKDMVINMNISAHLPSSLEAPGGISIQPSSLRLPFHNRRNGGKVGEDRWRSVRGVAEATAVAERKGEERRVERPSSCLQPLPSLCVPNR